MNCVRWIGDSVGYDGLNCCGPIQELAPMFLGTFGVFPFLLLMLRDPSVPRTGEITEWRSLFARS
jgi:hypothetical protein